MILPSTQLPVTANGLELKEGAWARGMRAGCSRSSKLSRKGRNKTAHEKAEARPLRINRLRRKGLAKSSILVNHQQQVR